MLNSYLDLYFEVIKKAVYSRYGDGNEIKLVKLGPVASFSNFKSSTSSRKHLEDISHVDIVSLMYKLINSAKDCDDLSVGFDRSRDKTKQEITKKKENILL